MREGILPGSHPRQRGGRLGARDRGGRDSDGRILDPMPSLPPSAPRILVVEDEAVLAELIRTNLEPEGFLVALAGTGEAALAAQSARPADLVVLDLMLPGMGGFEVLRTLRRRKDRTPVLILTSRSGSEDRIQGLHYGADDYMEKPFAMLELVARIRAILRRSDPDQAERRVLLSGPFRIDLLQFAASRGRTDLNLTMKEFRILEVLVSHPGRVHSRQEIINLAWDRDARPTLRTVDKHIQSLRGKLGDTDAHPCIQTLEREGYRWQLPVRE